jgi:hypothetical protein
MSTPTATKVGLVAILVVTIAAIAGFVGGRADGPIDSQFAAGFLWLFSGLFLLRVGGQLYVRLRGPAWLPPTEDWNLTPYRVLLPVQVVILGVMAWIDFAFASGEGLPVEPRPGLGEGVLVFSYVYAAVMATRYIVQMIRRPSERWFGGTIPIVFHFVLAAYLYVFGSFHASH